VAKERTNPSAGAKQYGNQDVSGSTYCRAFVGEVGVWILVDTGSAVTLITEECLKKIDPVGQLPRTPERIPIQSVTGEIKYTKGRVSRIPVQFENAKPWFIVADIIDGVSTSDVIFGRNALAKYEAKISCGKMEKLTLSETISDLEGKEQKRSQTIDIVDKQEIQSVVAVITPMEIDQPEQNNWRTKKRAPRQPKCTYNKGRSYHACTKHTPIDITPSPCSICKDDYEENQDYEEAVEWFDNTKCDSHTDIWRSYKDGLSSMNDVQQAYRTYLKGSALKRDGCVVWKGRHPDTGKQGNWIIGHVGQRWDQHYREMPVKDYLNAPEWQKDPLFDRFSTKWQESFKVISKDDPNISEKDKRMMEAWEEAQERKELAKQGIHKIALPIDEKEEHWRESIVQIKDDHCLIDTKKIKWEEIQTIQSRLTHLAPHGQPPYNWQGPDTQCWHHHRLWGPMDKCQSCEAMVEIGMTLSRLPESVYAKLVEEGKLKIRKRLAPIQAPDKRFPTKWQTMNQLTWRRRTRTAVPPLMTPYGYRICASKDTKVEGFEWVQTDLDVQIPPDHILLPSAIDPSSAIEVVPRGLNTQHRLCIPVKCNQGRIIQKGDPIAFVVILQSTLPGHQIVAAGQKVVDEPEYFVQDLTETQKYQLERLLEDYEDVFMEKEGKVGLIETFEHYINTRPHEYAWQQPWRASWHNEKIIAEEIKKMLAAGIIEPVKPTENEKASPFAAPVVIVSKKDGSNRFCVDFRRLNEITFTNTYQLPMIDRIFADMARDGNKPAFFSALDLASGYWHVPVYKPHIEKTTFVCHLGQYRFLRMPFGLKNAPASFQKIMDHIFHDQINVQKHMAVYIDDIMVHSHNFEDHLKHLEKTFLKCRTNGLRLKRKKCKFACETLEFLGHVIGKEGITVEERKVQAIKSYGTPTSKQQVRAFLGMAGYYARFIQGYQDIAKPLTALIQMRIGFHWDENIEGHAFRQLKERLQAAPILAYPYEETEGRFTLTTDASDKGLGAVLSQRHIKKDIEFVIAFASRTLRPAEMNYSTTEKEALAVVWAVTEKFKRYLHGRPFKLVTDHNALIAIFTTKEPTGRIGRWVEKLQNFNFTIEHKKGVENFVADAFSRDPNFYQ
jgi:hypothetical protein